MGNVRDAVIAVLQHLGGGRQLGFANVAAEADAEGIAKHGPQVTDRIPQLIGQLGEREFSVQVGADAGIDAFEQDITRIVARLRVSPLLRNQGQALHRAQQMRQLADERQGFRPIRQGPQCSVPSSV